MSQKFNLQSDFDPAGDQPKVIRHLTEGIQNGRDHQTLLGVTGSGKTFTMANVIQNVQMPTLVLAHNKTLAAQLAEEYRNFFPENAVHYFVSYYDYYQPEAYVPTTDTYIEKETQINDEIDRLRHASTQALLTRKDVIIVATVSCIYGLGSPDRYLDVNLKIEKGDEMNRREFLRQLIDIHFERTNADLSPGEFRVVENAVEIMPVDEKAIYRVNVDAGTVANIEKIDPVTREYTDENMEVFFLFPAEHFVADDDQIEQAVTGIRHEMKERVKDLQEQDKLLEAQRLKRRTKYDIAMIEEVGYCSGIENYAIHFDDRQPGEPPNTLLSFFPHDKDGNPEFLTVIDESHVTVPQVRGMYGGDRSRKETLVEHGYRLPTAKDNRPLKFEEFKDRIGQVVYTSATPGDYEIRKSCVNIELPDEEEVDGSLQTEVDLQGCNGVCEQIIRPTGLVDPAIDIRPVVEDKGGVYPGQVRDLISEAKKEIAHDHRVIATTLTKKMAEDLADFLEEEGIEAEWLHSEIDTIERVEILREFRKGTFDVIVGVNLLREGLDLPEVSLIGILDADKEGFLRSETSLIQTMGRAARNVDGRVILYAEEITGSMQRAIDETERRREKQLAYNTKHDVTPETIEKEISDITDQLTSEHDEAVDTLLRVDADRVKNDPDGVIKEKREEMNEAVKQLDFETAAVLRDEIQELQKIADEHEIK